MMDHLVVGWQWYDFSKTRLWPVSLLKVGVGGRGSEGFYCCETIMNPVDIRSYLYSSETVNCWICSQKCKSYLKRNALDREVLKEVDVPNVHQDIFSCKTKEPSTKIRKPIRMRMVGWMRSQWRCLFLRPEFFPEWPQFSVLRIHICVWGTSSSNLHGIWRPRLSKDIDISLESLRNEFNYQSGIGKEPSTT